MRSSAFSSNLGELIFSNARRANREVENGVRFRLPGVRGIVSLLLQAMEALTSALLGVTTIADLREVCFNYGELMY